MRARLLFMMAWLLPHDFLRAFVASNDFDGRKRRGRGGGDDGRRLRARGAAAAARTVRTTDPMSAAGLMPGVAGAVLSSGLRSAS